ncbi:MAG: PEP/pyruvate-binding domain-containing protein [Anaerolineales bacterium]|nr:PEP/pyruvate-binding domain-containing protein [Anaerolineales bacterium]
MTDPIDENVSNVKFDLQQLPKVMQTYLELQQYPILSREIRRRMRQEVFERGVILPKVFEQEVEAKAIESQVREGIINPLFEESSNDWADRMEIIRDQLTDFYFSHNLPHDLLIQIVQQTVSKRLPDQEVVLSFNPELAPWDLLFAQAERWKELPPDEYAEVKHHIKEFIVVLIKGMISDQLAFVGIAREYLTLDDMREIRRRRIGRGKIGGKAAGLLLAWKILKREAEIAGAKDVCDHVKIPESYYLGADAFYDFMSLNNLHAFMNQKYRERDDVGKDFSSIQAIYQEGRFPLPIVSGLKSILEEVGNAPLIVRSSSLLEDNFGFSFSGKYESVFCPNQGSLEENLEALQDAIRQVYASVLNPAALFYRRHHDLLDYDERMAILIQKVEGKQREDYFFPTLAGVAFSRNPHRWNPRIRPAEGFVRLVLGMGTRAVDRVANDYPRMIALSHPSLRPEVTPQQIKRYSQRFVDLIDLRENKFKTVPLSETPLKEIRALRYLVSIDENDHLRPMVTSRSQAGPDRMVLTFDQLLRKTNFASIIKQTLKLLEIHYKRPVDIEFALDVQYNHPDLELTLTLLQCRPLSSRDDVELHQIPPDIPIEDTIFTADRMVPDGAVRDIEYIIYINPNKYDRIQDDATRLELARIVGLLNKRLEGHNFILMGPGRWGSSNIELGVKVTYADIYNSRALIEVAMPRDKGRPEVSYGTHFFQDLVEANIYPLALYPGEPGIIFNKQFLDKSHNQLTTVLSKESDHSNYIQVIHVPTEANGRTFHLVMNTAEETAIGYLA